MPPTHFPQRTVVGALFEFESAWQAALPLMSQPPHHKPPTHPVLYIKPANTWCGPGQAVVLPTDVAEVQVGATLGISFCRTASRVQAAHALGYVSGYCVVNDITEPHTSLLRPPMRQKCRDGYCPVGPWVPAAQVGDPSRLVLKAYVNGQLRQATPLNTLRHNVAQLIASVSEFMSLAPGDLLLVGVAANPPLARAGDTMVVEIEGLGQLENRLRSEAAAPKEAA